MLRPKNFRELRKSIITQNEEANFPSPLSRENQRGIENQAFISGFQTISFIGSTCHSQNVHQNQDHFYRQTVTPNTCYQNQNQTAQNLCVSPIRNPQSFLSPNDKYQNQITRNYQETILSDPPKTTGLSQNNSSNEKKANRVLQFDGNIKRKLNFNNVSNVRAEKETKEVKERFSSKKKQIPGISFKSIIENSPKCKQLESDRLLKNPNSDHKQLGKRLESERLTNNQNSGHKQFTCSPLKPRPAESERLADRQSSLNKLQYQFAGVKKMISKRQSEKESADLKFKENVLEKKSTNVSDNQQLTENQFEKISFSKKIIRKGTKANEVSVIISKPDSSPISAKAKLSAIIATGNPTKTLQKYGNARKPLNTLFADKTPLDDRANLNESQSDLVNMSRDSRCSQLDMSPYL